MSKLWRVYSKKEWPEFAIDIFADNVLQAIKRFEEYEEKKQSIAKATSIIKIELIGDSVN